MRSKIITLDNNLDVNVTMWGENHESSLILLHGLGSTGKSFNELATILSQRFNVFAFDLPGHGGSTFLADEDFFSLESLADWVKDVLSHLKLEEFHIIGHSLAGYIGLAFANKYFLKSLILLDGGYIRASKIPENTLKEEIEMTEQYVEAYTFASWLKYEQDLANNGFTKRQIELSKESMECENGTIKLIIKSDTAKFLVKQKFNEPSTKTLSDINSPVLLLRSTVPEEFNVIRDSETNRLKQYIDLVVLDVKDATHEIHWDQPKYLGEQIINWVNRNYFNLK